MRQYRKGTRILAALMMTVSAAFAQGLDDDADSGIRLFAREQSLDFGPYVHYLESRVTADFKRQSGQIIRNLRGLNSPCRRCDTDGTVTVILREGYYDEYDVWIPPLKDERVCPTCDGRCYLFNESVARKFVSRGLPSASRSRRGSQWTRDRLLRRLASSTRLYRTLPKTRHEIRGRFATLDASSGDGVFPLRFQLIPDGTKFVWRLHDPESFSSFAMESEFEPLPKAGVVSKVLAGDIIQVAGDHTIRLAGITIPGKDGKIVRKPASTPTNRDAWALAREELLGKTVELRTDKYAQFTCRGFALAYVFIDGKNYSVELVRRGTARCHPKHKTQFAKLFIDAEKAARDARAGVWAKLLD